MPFQDWLYGGGLFGGSGGYDNLSREAMERASRRGLMTSGALIMGNSVGPNNRGFMGNISSALLAGREDFDSILDREAQMEAMRERERKIAEIEAEKIRMQEEAEERKFQEWQMAEGKRTHAIDTIIRATGKSFEDINNMDDSTLGNVYESIILPKPEPKSKIKYTGRIPIEVDQDGNEIYRKDLPVLPSLREPKEPLTPEEQESKLFAIRERWVQNYMDDLARDADIEEKFDPTTGAKVGVIRTPKYGDAADRRRMALEAWDQARSKGSRLMDSAGDRSSDPLEAIERAAARAVESLSLGDAESMAKRSQIVMRARKLLESGVSLDEILSELR